MFFGGVFRTVQPSAAHTAPHCATLRQNRPAHCVETLRHSGGYSILNTIPHAAHCAHLSPRTLTPRTRQRRTATDRRDRQTLGDSNQKVKRLAHSKGRARPPRRPPSSPSAVRALDLRPITRRPSPFPVPARSAESRYCGIVGYTMRPHYATGDRATRCARSRAAHEASQGDQRHATTRGAHPPPRKSLPHPPTRAPLGLLWYLPPREPRPGIRFPRDSCRRKYALANWLPN